MSFMWFSERHGAILDRPSKKTYPVAKGLPRKAGDVKAEVAERKATNAVRIFMVII